MKPCPTKLLSSDLFHLHNCSVVYKLNLYVQDMLFRKLLPTYMAEGADDDVTIVVHLILKHVDNEISNAAILFIDNVPLYPPLC